MNNIKDNLLHNHKPYAAFKKPPKPYRLNVFNVLLVLAVFACLVAEGMVKINDPVSENPAGSDAVSFAIVLVLLIGISGNVYIENRKRKSGDYNYFDPISEQSTESFIHSTDWKITNSKSLNIVPSKILSIGTKHRIDFSFEGNYSQHDFVGAQLGFLLDSKAMHKEDEIWGTATSLKFDLGNDQFPFLGMYRKSNDQKFNSDPVTFLKNSKSGYGVPLEVEGDFNKTFEVRILKDTESDVLAFLTPDLMDELLLTDYDFSFEIGSNQLYIYTNITSEVLIGSGVHEMHNLLGGADVAFKHINHVARSWNSASTAKEIKELRGDVIKMRQTKLKVPLKKSEDPFAIPTPDVY